MTETSATRTETNREIIRQAFDAWRQGTGAITDVFAPDMVWRIEGHSAASREYRSKQQFVDEVLAPFGARFTVSEPFRPVTIRAVYADDDTVIVIWDGRGIASDGQPLGPRWSLREVLVDAAPGPGDDYIMLGPARDTRHERLSVRRRLECGP
jgi:ketosteroid isomerase-like protein